MTKPSWITSSLAIGALLVFASFAQAADVRQTKQLTDRQMDKIAAGALASAVGDSTAKGDLAFTETTTTIVGSTDAMSTVSGQTRAIGMANANFSASATSSLHLSYSSP